MGTQDKAQAVRDAIWQTCRRCQTDKTGWKRDPTPEGGLRLLLSNSRYQKRRDCDGLAIRGIFAPVRAGLSRKAVRGEGPRLLLRSLCCAVFWMAAIVLLCNVRDSWAGPPRKPGIPSKLAQFSRILSYIEHQYVEDVNQDELVYGAIKGMLDSLDPHTVFLRPEQYREMKLEAAGQLAGIGIEVEQRDSVFAIVSVLDSSPAARAGLLPGDQLLRVDDQPLQGLADYLKKMRGKRGSSVTLTVLRSGWKDPRQFAMVRDLIKIRSVESFLLERGYGVLKIKQFTDNLDKEVETQLAALEKESGGKLSGLVLDLRNNPGGLLDQAVRLADLFIDGGLIVRTEGRGGRILDEEHATTEGTRLGFPIVCLVNGGSASAAEIVAGALQDHGRALILGTQTFGKGSVQTIVELEDGSALKLTIARYYTPAGRSIQEKGISPDVLLEQMRLTDAKNTFKEEPQQKERDLNGHLRNRQKNTKDAGPPPGYGVIAQHSPQGEDFQLRTAYDYLKTWHLFAARLLQRGLRPDGNRQGKARIPTEQPTRLENRALRNDASHNAKDAQQSANHGPEQGWKRE